MAAHLARSRGDSGVRLWDLRDPPDAEPVVLKRPVSRSRTLGGFDPERPLAGHEQRLRRRVLAPLESLDARAAAASSASTWGLDVHTRRPLARLVLTGCAAAALAPRPGRRRHPHPASAGAVLGRCDAPREHPRARGVRAGRRRRPPLANRRGHPRHLRTGWEGTAGTCAVAFDATGQRAAAAPTSCRGPQGPELHASCASGTWHRERARTYSLAHLTDASWWGCDSVRFAPDGSRLVGRRRWRPSSRSPGGSERDWSPARPCYAAGHAKLDLSRDGRQLLVIGARDTGGTTFEELLLFDLAAHTSRPDHHPWPAPRGRSPSTRRAGSS